MQMVPISQVMLGSDYPFREGIEAIEGLDNYKFSPADLKAIWSENAIRVMPRLRV
jgi:predicted TIM-barrel fold metal-dependent hydrolase